MSELKKLFGAKVRHYRIHAGMTQAELAERLDVTTEMVGKMERGTSGASFATIDKLCEVLNAPAGSLFPNVVGDNIDILDELLIRLSKLNPDELQWAKNVFMLMLGKPK